MCYCLSSLVWQDRIFHPLGGTAENLRSCLLHKGRGYIWRVCNRNLECLLGILKNRNSWEEFPFLLCFLLTLGLQIWFHARQSIFVASYLTRHWCVSYINVCSHLFLTINLTMSLIQYSFFLSLLIISEFQSPFICFLLSTSVSLSDLGGVQLYPCCFFPVWRQLQKNFFSFKWNTRTGFLKSRH